MFGIGSCLGAGKSPITNEIVKMGTLNCFEELISKLTIKCCNSLIGLCLDAKKRFVTNEIVQMNALNFFLKLLNELIFTCCMQKTYKFQRAFNKNLKL